MSPPEHPSFAVAIPTRNRVAKLDWCLEALAGEQGDPFSVYVLDSSTSPEIRDEVAAVCGRYPFVRLRFHDGINLAMARNECARAVEETLVINVDDDIQVQPGSIRRLVEAYLAQPGPGVVAGSVAWDGVWSRPIKLRFVGWGRNVRVGESPDFLIGAFFIYPKALALAFPWHERTLMGPRRGVADDRYIGAIWRGAGVALRFEPQARAIHHREHTSYGLPDEAARVYSNLVQGLIGSRSLLRTTGFVVFGLGHALVHLHGRPSTTRVLLRAWTEAHRSFAQDYRGLRQLVRRDLPPLAPAQGVTSTRPGLASPAG